MMGLPGNYGEKSMIMGNIESPLKTIGPVFSETDQLSCICVFYTLDKILSSKNKNNTVENR